MIYLDYAKATPNGYILNFFADKEADLADISNGKRFVTKNGIDYGVPQPSSTVVITMPDKTKKTYVLNEAGEWQEGGVDMDYSKLENAPITLANLADKDFVPEANTYYEHLGETTKDFIKGIIYLYDGKEYKAIDGSGSGGGVQSDYNQNDSTAADYIKNRPFYEENSLTEVADFKVISGNLKEVGSEVIVEYNGERFTGTVTESSGDYELQIEGSEQAGFSGAVNIYDGGLEFQYSHKKTYEVKSGDEIIFNGAKYSVKVVPFAVEDVGGKCYISDGEFDPETLSPISMSFIYIFSIVDAGELTLDYYVINKSTTDVDFSLKTGQQVIKTIDPKFIKDMYYETTVETEILLEQTFTTQPEAEAPDLNVWETTENKISLKEGNIVNVLFNGTKYTLTVKKDFGSVLYIGNLYIFDKDKENTGEPFAVANTALSTLKDGTTIITEQPQTNATIKVYKSEDIIKTIDHKYIKDMYYEAPSVVFDENVTTAQSGSSGPYIWGTTSKVINANVGDEIKVIFNGTEYTQAAKDYEGILIYVGNLSIFETGENTKEPFLIVLNVDMITSGDEIQKGVSIATQTAYNGEVKIMTNDVKTINPKYIKDMYYTKPESEIQKILVFKGEISVSTQEVSSLFKAGDVVSLKEEAVGLDVTDEAKIVEVDDGSGSVVYIGNLSFVGSLFGISDAVDTKETYIATCVYSKDGTTALIYIDQNKKPPNNIEIYKGADPIVRIPEKYLPLDIAKKSYVDTAISDAITKTLNTEV